jgi:hypothetical protein
MFFAFLVPGAGHLYLGRRGRAIAFFFIVMIMFVVGLLLDGKLYVPEAGKPLTVLATLGSMGAGLPYFIARMMGRFIGDVTSITYEYGNAFTLTAGLMNLLLVLDSYDIAEERKS